LPEYSNPELPEEVNNSDRSPFRHFLLLAVAAALVGAVAALILAFAGGRLAAFVPFEVEAKLVAPYAEKFPPKDHAAEKYLQALADRLVKDLELPTGMRVQVHYVDDAVVNAFATLGGHVAVHRGLIERMPDENTLAMVLAHEIGHAKHRHPSVSMGRGLAVAATLSAFSATAGNSALDRVFGNAGMLTLLTFSRSQEEEADETGLALLVKQYGHAGGSQETFKVLAQAAALKGRYPQPKFFSTHPLTQERLERMAALAAKREWKADGPRISIPPEVRAAIEKDAKRK
jgi:predicted Zn-dependent protease